MNLLYLLILVGFIILILWLVSRFIADPEAKKILTYVIAIGGAIMILYFFGVWDYLAGISVRK